MNTHSWLGLDENTPAPLAHWHDATGRSIYRPPRAITTDPYRSMSPTFERRVGFTPRPHDRARSPWVWPVRAMRWVFIVMVATILTWIVSIVSSAVIYYANEIALHHSLPFLPFLRAAFAGGSILGTGLGVILCPQRPLPNRWIHDVLDYRTVTPMHPGWSFLFPIAGAMAPALGIVALKDPIITASVRDLAVLVAESLASVPTLFFIGYVMWMSCRRQRSAQVGTSENVEMGAM
ncbi:hypothetical protein L226DRAFT_537162 [Lentinus tigrinus ALCF2SS1-7]|uniref:uncharacterized protein n=1 Tax=Lentinus tigrinus ALCF2SS1-7 TaxID=1328758 RepID=UPI001166121D|nr:hypothetical protein L226DRAFT_537162 [Lentinus tigrinus ALCF2SS1-7]